MERLSEMRLNAENKLKKRREYKKGLFGRTYDEMYITVVLSGDWIFGSEI